MKPGIYHLSREEYEAIDAVRFSHLKHMAKSPLHFRAAVTGHVKPGKSMRLGSLAHCLVLEPERYDDLFAVYEHPEGKKAVFKGQNYDTFAAANPGKTIIKADELNHASSIAHAILTYGPARRYLDKIETELSLVWRDEKTGLLCKALIDGLSHSVSNVIVELKSTTKVDPWNFRKQYADMLYHVQAAWYGMGYRALTDLQAYQKCFAVEAEQPHDVIVYDCAEVIDVGESTARELLDKVATCRLARKWPGQAGETEQSLTLPKYLEDDEEELDSVGLEWGESA